MAEVSAPSTMRPAAGTAAGEIDGHGRPERVAKDYDPVGRHAAVLPQEAIRRIGVPIEPLLAWRAFALTIAPVIEREEAQAELPQAGVVERPVELREVARVSMTDEQPQAARIRCRRDDPSHQLDPVLGRNLDPLDGKPEPGGRRRRDCVAGPGNR